MIRRKALGRARSVTTDNGCEFLDPKRIKAAVGCDVYYTRAYASWEKGSVENCNRASSAGGTRREPTSAGARERTCTGSSAS